VAKVEDK